MIAVCIPGQFVNVVLTLGTASQATVVPSQAVQIGQDKSFVYVAKADGTAEIRTVKTGTTMESMTVIEEGLKPGEQVITDGQLRLVPGSKIQVKGQGQGGRGQGRGQIREIRIRVEKVAVVSEARETRALEK